MLDKFLNIIFGSKHEKDLKEILSLLYSINEKESWAIQLAAEDFPKTTKQLKDRARNGESPDSLLPEAFALVREAARRTIGERPFDVQLLGGIVLHQGKVMEMKTGEGKTLSSVTAAYLNALGGNGVHIVTVNDYLAERDAAWMKPIYSYLDISVGAILSQMDNEARKLAYESDITYGTNNEFGFDYLRDNMRWNSDLRAQSRHHFCIIDEIDSILIDEARTPLIISGAAEDDTRKFQEVNGLVNLLNECEKDAETGEYPEEPVGDFKVDEKSKRILFTDEGLNNVETYLTQRKLINGSVFLDENFEYIHYFTQALKAHRLFKKDVDYVVQDQQVQIVDEFTGRILHGRRYSDGLHQAIEAKEKIKVAKRNRTLATITFQNFFRMYDKISGMTGTADTEAREFAKIYNLDVVVIPTNKPLIRLDEDDVIYLNETDKFNALCLEIQEAHRRGQPVLCGTVSIEKSEVLSGMLTKLGIRHEVLNAKNHAREALIISEAGSIGAVTLATNMAGRGTDIKLGGNPEYRARKKAGTEAPPEEYAKALESEYALWRSDYEKVKSAGGLYVIGTERHESRRIDNQLRGRSGRQGDPGRSRFYISLDDDLMRLFSDNLKPLMQRIGMKEGDPIFHPWINKSIEKAQGRVEERNFEIRKHLLDYDNVLNEQREFIYKRRDEILLDNSLTKRVLESSGEIVADLVEELLSAKEQSSSSEALFYDNLKEAFFLEAQFRSENIHKMQPDVLEEQILDEIKLNLKEKDELVGQQQFNLFIRYEYLKSIDSKWQDHLENLEALREAVYLRAYGQKNPLLEYKLEGFQIFDKLIYDIRSSIAKKIVRVKIQQPKSEQSYVRSQNIGEARHTQMEQFSASGSGNAISAPKAAAQTVAPQKVQVTRSYPKVGRNDSCPCGSGKKYKYCHGL